MNPRVLFSGAELTPVAAPKPRTSQTVAKTPSGVRLRYLTRQLASHRERICMLEERNAELESLLNSATSGQASGDLIARTSVLESELLIAQADAADWRSQLEAAADTVTRLRAQLRSEQAGAVRGGAVSAANSPSQQYRALLAALRGSPGVVTADMRPSPAGSDVFEDAAGPSTWAGVVVHPRVMEAAEHCSRGR